MITMEVSYPITVGDGYEITQSEHYYDQMKFLMDRIYFSSKSWRREEFILIMNNEATDSVLRIGSILCV